MKRHWGIPRKQDRREQILQILDSDSVASLIIFVVIAAFTAAAIALVLP